MKKDIPIKNYAILFLLFFISIILTYYLISLYNNNKIVNNYYISGVLKEIKIDELSNYMIENNNNIILVIYENDDFNKIDKKLKKYILNNDIKSELVYVIVNDDNYNSLNEKTNYKVIKQTNLLYIKDGSISSALYDSITELSYKEFEKFLDEKRNEI